MASCESFGSIVAILGLSTDGEASVAAVYIVVSQALGIAIVGPMIHAVSLMNHDVVRNPTWHSLGADSRALRAVPWSMLIGFVVPTVVMVMLPCLKLGAEWGVFVIKVWLFFPVWFNLSQVLLTKSILRDFGVRKKTPTISQCDEDEITLLRTCYRQGLALAMVTNILSWSVSLCAICFPGFFDSRVARDLQPHNVFVPPLPWSGIEAQSLVQGSHWILLWDDLLMGAIYLVWAATILRCCNVSSVRVIRLALTSVLVGPCGAALLMVWERDELVHSEIPTKKPTLWG